MKPLTRKEMLLDGAAKGNLDTFKPATREEVFAKRALANAGGGGGGSGGGMCVVRITDDDTSASGYVADKTFAEIDDLMKHGTLVICCYTFRGIPFFAMPVDYELAEHDGEPMGIYKFQTAKTSGMSIRIDELTEGNVFVDYFETVDSDEQKFQTMHTSLK